MTTVRPAHRFTMKKGIVAPIGVTAMVLASLAVGLPAAQAANDGSQTSTHAEFGEWAWSGFTSWQPTPTPPADPDSQDGEANPLNLAKIGEGGPGQSPGVYAREVEGGLTTETSDWVRARPDGEGWVQLSGPDGERSVRDAAAYDETVVDKKAWTETVVDEKAHWQRYSWAHGQKATDTAPRFPSSAWQPNTKSDPHRVGVEGAYFRSNGGAGKGDWFYLDWVAAVTHTVQHPAETHLVHHPEVSHQEFRYQRQVMTEGHTEYRWSVYGRTHTPGEPVVEEPTDPSDPIEPVEPVLPSQPIAPSIPHEPAVQNAVSTQKPASGHVVSTQPATRAGTSPAVPLSIDAGL